MEVRPHFLMGILLLALCFWYGYMLQMLYLMATPMARLSIWWKLRSTQENRSEDAYPQVRCAGTASRHASYPFMSCVPPVHTLQDNKARTRGVPYVLPLVFSRRYCVIMVLARGIVLFYYYYWAPWSLIWGRACLYKAKEIIGLVCFWVEYLKIWSIGLLFQKAWCIWK